MVLEGVRSLRAEDALPTRSDRTGDPIEVIEVKGERIRDHQNTPISITSLPDELIKDAGIHRVEDLFRYLPNVQYRTTDRTVLLWIRGLGSLWSSIEPFDSPAAFLADELTIADQSFLLNPPLYDLERVELYRGPQGTEFGKNAPMGVLRFDSASPTDELSGFFFSSLGDRLEHKLEAAIGGPIWSLGELLRFRLAALDTSHSRDIRNAFRDERNEIQQRAGRLKLEVTPLSSLDVLAIGEIMQLDGRGSRFQWNDLSPDSMEFARRYDPSFEDDGHDGRNAYDHPRTSDFTTHRAQTNIRYDPGNVGIFGAVSVLAVLGYLGADGFFPNDSDFTPADIDHIGPHDYSHVAEQASAELRISTVLTPPLIPGSVKLSAGFLRQHLNFHTSLTDRLGKDIDAYLASEPFVEATTTTSNADGTRQGVRTPGGLGLEDLGPVFGVAPLLPAPSEGDGANLSFHGDRTSTGFFTNASLSLWQRWTFGAGVRLSMDDMEGRATFVCFDPGLMCPFFGWSEYDVTGRQKDTALSPRFTVQYAPFEGLTLFAVYAQGFRAGGLDMFVGLNDPEAFSVDPEYSTDWEVGAKGSPFDGALDYSLNLYRITVHDLQFVDRPPGSGAFGVLKNFGTTRSEGVESDFDWQTPWPALSVWGAGSFTHATFLDFPDDALTNPSVSILRNVVGRPMPYTPKWQASVTPTLRLPLARLPFFGGIAPRWFDLKAAVDVLFKSKTELSYLRYAKQPAYGLLNGRIGVVSRDEAWSLTLAGTNLTDAQIRLIKSTALYPLPNGSLIVEEFPRALSVELRHEF